MVCAHHSHENGVNTCSVCGEWLCETCSVDINGRIVCKQCIARRMEDRLAPASAVPSRCYGGFLLFIFSVILPGLNFMYLGLIKRGLFFMSTFFAIVLAMTLTEIWVLSFLIPILWAANFFDGFEKRRLLNAGVHVPDSVDDILNWMRKYKTPVIITGIIVLAYGTFDKMLRYISYSMMGYMPGPHYNNAFQFMAGLAVLLVGGYFLVKAASKSKGERPKTDDYLN